jgi:hypothetical protein
MKSALRAWKIGRVLLRYRLDDLLDDTPVERWLKLMRPFVPRASAAIAFSARWCAGRSASSLVRSCTRSALAAWVRRIWSWRCSASTPSAPAPPSS